MGRRVGSRTAAGLEVLVPDGDHAVATYRPDGTLARRSLFGDRIDEVIADQADLDASRDGIPDTTLYPVQDAQGTLLGLVDRDGRIVESYLMDASGRARIHGRDETRPEIALLRYRVGGEGSTLPAWIEVVLSEGVRGQGTGDSGPGSGGATFALKDSSGTSIATTLDASRAGEGVLVFGLGSGLAAGSYSVELSGVEDVAGNFVETFAGTGSITDPAQDVVLATGPRAGHVLAILDGPDGVAIVTNVPIDPANVAGVVTVQKQGEVVASAMQLLGETTLLWIPENPAAWIEGASYEVTLAAGLFDIAGRPITTPTGALTFTHLAQGDAIWTRPSEAPLRQQSAYGNDRFLHGRPYLADLGLSDHRARFYDLDAQTFLSPDPLGPIDSANGFAAFLVDSSSVIDPAGTYGIDFHYYVVYLMAYLATGDSDRATRISWGSQYLDTHPETRPNRPGGFGRFIFHFPEVAGIGTRMGGRNKLAGAAIHYASSTGSDLALGLSLHMLADSFGHAGFSWKGGLAENYQDSSRVWLYDRGLLGVGHLPAIISFRDVDDPSMAPGRAAQAALSILDVISRSTGDNTLIGKKYFLSREHLRGWLVGMFASTHGRAKARAASWRRQLEMMGTPVVPFQDVPEQSMLTEFESALQDTRGVIRSLGRECSWVPAR